MFTGRYTPVQECGRGDQEVKTTRWMKFCESYKVLRIQVVKKKRRKRWRSPLRLLLLPGLLLLPPLLLLLLLPLLPLNKRKTRR